MEKVVFQKLQQNIFLKMKSKASSFPNRIWVYNSGLNRDFQSLSPGWVLLGYLLQWAITNGRSEFDFMRGDEEYKYRFGAVNQYVMRVKLTRSK